MSQPVLVDLLTVPQCQILRVPRGGGLPRREIAPACRGLDAACDDAACCGDPWERERETCPEGCPVDATLDADGEVG